MKPQITHEMVDNGIITRVALPAEGKKAQRVRSGVHQDLHGAVEWVEMVLREEEPAENSPEG